jgi:Ankyrin repeats (3 copies)
MNEIHQYNNENSDILHVAISMQISVGRVLELIDLCPMAVRHRSYGAYGAYPIHVACTYFQSDAEIVIRKLAQVYPNACTEEDDYGKYPIHCALNGDQPIPVFKLLIDLDPLALQRQTKDKGYAPLHTACMLGSQESLIEYLIRHPKILVNCKDHNGNTPLHVACYNQSNEAFKILFKHPNIDVNVRNNFGLTPLHIRYLSTVQQLLDHPHIFINKKDNYGETPLDKIQSHIQEYKKLFPEASGHICCDTNAHECIEIKCLLEEFTVKRRWQAYQYFLSSYNDGLL